MAIEIDLGVLLAIVIPIGTVCVLCLLVLACVLCMVLRPSRRSWLCGSRHRDSAKVPIDPPKLSVEIDNEPRLSQLNQLYGPDPKQGNGRSNNIKRVSGQRTSRPDMKLGSISESPKVMIPTWPHDQHASPWEAPSPPEPAVNRPSAKLYGQPQIQSVENCARIDYTSGIESVSASIVTDPSEKHASLLSIQQTPKSVYSPTPTQYFTPTRPERPGRPERPERPEQTSEPAVARNVVRERSSEYSSPLPPTAQWSHRSSSHSGSERGKSISTICDKPLPQLPTPSNGGVVADLNGAMFKAIFAYTPVLYDELALKQGDMVRCHQVFDDGWCMASQVGTSERGICPRACLAEI